MRSVPLREAHLVAEAYDRKLNEIGREARKMDDRFNNSVQVIHEEGTTFFFHNAFVVQWGVWYIVIAEHHDIHVYEDDEVRVVMFKRIHEEFEQITDLEPLGIDEETLKWGPDPNGTLKQKAEEEARLDAELDAESEAD